jgi:hypothetical protein
MQSLEWKQAIAELARVRHAACAADHQNLYTFRLPRVAATESELRAVESHLGHLLDPHYRMFLQHAGGWPSFHQAVDVFGPEELLGGGKWPRAVELLGILQDEGTLALGKLNSSMLLPFAVSEDDFDVFVLAKDNSPFAGAVLWYAGYEIERNRNFDDFFMAIIEYEKLRLRRLRNG